MSRVSYLRHRPPHYVGYGEYRRHWLFRVLRQFVMRRSGGKCEVCYKREATEVHHQQYPAWGSFDTPANMKAICHECHCEAHGKPD